MNSAESILKASSERVNVELAKLRLRYAVAPARLLDAIDYSLLAGGKRLRPTLIFESAKACGESSPSEATLAAACAIELIHTFSLVHDDLPAMDDDDLRRGRPTSHRQFDEATAILAGDAMVAMAFEILAEISDARLGVRLISELSRATGPVGMIGGQMLDIAAEHQSLDLDALQGVHRMKTGALLTSALRMGAQCAGATAEKLAALTTYGQHLGLAFQIVDDILDVTSSSEALGKATHKDVARGKNTYPALLGLDAARAESARQVQLAVGAIEHFTPLPAGLVTIAEFVVNRLT